jgi:hypothetical protein
MKTAFRLVRGRFFDEPGVVAEPLEECLQSATHHRISYEDRDPSRHSNPDSLCKFYL